ncbi:hypothetical protein, partial [Aeromonas veronii]|uniref:hypothetical protein n=1 Tax=Aeromonas veronii TaxID=654 RepID=UPI00224750EA
CRSKRSEFDYKTFMISPWGAQPPFNIFFAQGAICAAIKKRTVNLEGELYLSASFSFPFKVT